MSSHYITEKDYSNPRASPLLTKDFSSAPPTLVIVAELDPLRDGCYCNEYTVFSIIYKLAFAPIEDSDQPAYSHSLIRVCDGRSMGSQGSKVSLGRKLRLD